jgi:putative hydrolase of the HAD superfamily
LDNIEHIFFDLDHTLWDFDSNSRQTLNELYHEFDLSSFGIEKPEHFIERYILQNEKLWAMYRENRISKNRLRNARFEATLRDFKINDKQLSKDIGKAYVDQSPHKTKLNDGALSLLKTLNTKYSLHIISNGFQEVQMIKLNASGLMPFFKKIITSEKASAKKPNPRIFDYANKATGAEANKSLMVGDNYDIDILGALNANWRAIHYSPEGASKHGEVIRRLPDLLGYLE